jgi:diguanylate cyclase (GGDEF)-like protein
MNILLVSKNQSSGNMLVLSLQDALGPAVARIDLVNDPQVAFSIYKRSHPDVLLIDGFPSAFSEALIINAREFDGKRHTGVIVMAAAGEHFDQLAINNYNAGADDVVASSIGVGILRVKILSVFIHKMMADELRAAVHKMETIVMTDELTGLHNMRSFLKKFGKSVSQCAKGLTGVAVVMADLDHFKKVNDTMNHMVGSHVIKTVGQLIGKSKVLEGEDFACRYGGDEFLIVLHGLNPQDQMRKAEAMRLEIEKLAIRFQSYQIHVTSSMGLCWVPAKFEGAPENIVKGADAMLYRSKALGRNRLSGLTLEAGMDFSAIPDSLILPVPAVETAASKPRKKAG